MLDSNHHQKLKNHLKGATYPTSEILEKSALLEGFVNLFNDAGIQVMLQESEMDVMEYSDYRWISAVSYYFQLGKQIEDYIQADAEHWAEFRDATGVTEVEIFTRPFTDPLKCLNRVDLKDLGGWNDSPVKYGFRPALV